MVNGGGRARAEWNVPAVFVATTLATTTTTAATGTALFLGLFLTTALLLLLLLPAALLLLPPVLLLLLLLLAAALLLLPPALLLLLLLAAPLLLLLLLPAALLLVPLRPPQGLRNWMIFLVPLLTQLLCHLKVNLLMRPPAPPTASTTSSDELVTVPSVWHPHLHAALACGRIHTLGQRPIPPRPLCNLWREPVASRASVTDPPTAPLLTMVGPKVVARHVVDRPEPTPTALIGVGELAPQLLLQPLPRHLNVVPEG